MRRERENNKGNKDYISKWNVQIKDTHYDYLCTTIIGLGLTQLGLYLNIKSNQMFQQYPEKFS